MTIEVVDSIEQENRDLKERVVTEFTKIVEAIKGEWIPTLIKDRTMSFIANHECMTMTGSFQVATEEVPRYLDVEEPGVNVFTIDTDEDEIDISVQAIFFALERSFSKLGIQRPGPANPIVKDKSSTALVNCVRILNAIRAVDPGVAYPSIRITVVRGHDGSLYTRICGYVRAGSYVVRVQMGYQSDFFYNEGIFDREPSVLAHTATLASHVAFMAIKADGVIGDPVSDLCKVVWAKSCESEPGSNTKLMFEDFIRECINEAIAEIDISIRVNKEITQAAQSKGAMAHMKKFTDDFTLAYGKGLHYIGEHQSNYMVGAMQMAFISAAQLMYSFLAARAHSRATERQYRLNISLINRAMEL